METAVAAFPAKAHQQERVWLSWREHAITLLLAFWLMVGLFVDGWAHNNLRELETFFTPWHAVFYSGFVAVASWLIWLVWKQVRAGAVGMGAIPQGYHIGIIGVFVFALGGVGDMIWHIIFGIEQDIAILLSPTHLLLLLGGTMIFSCPFLAAWLKPDKAKPSFVSFLPTLGSLTLMTTFPSFMHMYLWSMLMSSGSISRNMENGLGSMLLTNVMLMAPILLMLRRWQPPFGSVTFLLCMNTLLMVSLYEFRPIAMMWVALGGGLYADLLIVGLKPHAHIWRYRITALLLPIGLWSMRFWVPIWMGDKIRWDLELSAGITTMCCLASFALSLLIAPPAIPQPLEVEPEKS
jgi:hypothetical protein